MLLAIDTATQFISLALHDGHEVVAEQSWRTNDNHNVELAPTVSALLHRVGVTPSDLSAVAVAKGPGSYSGLRVGVALAKALASVSGLPLVGVSTLDVLAAAQPHGQGGLIAVVRAGRGRVIAGHYQWRRGRWVARGEPQLVDWATLIDGVEGTLGLSGEVDEDGRRAIAEAQFNGIGLTLLPPVYRLRRAGFLAQEALAQLEDKSADFAPAHLAPYYVKSKDLP